MTQTKILNYLDSFNKAINWLESQLDDKGSYGKCITDLACYYKSPYLFYISGKSIIANQILNWIKHIFFQSNGDFLTNNSFKSENIAFAEYWSYTNGWITLAAQKMGRFDIAYPAFSYLNLFYDSDLGGFKTNQPNEEDNIFDILTTSHLGLISLYFGHLNNAEASGKLLQKIIDQQPNLEQQLYLRINQKGQLVTQFSENSSLFYRVSTKEPNQAYFMIGYPIAFLGKLYLATQNIDYLNTAIVYLNYAMQCHDNIRSFYFSHKVAWGASIIANLTKERNYLNFAIEIADYLVSIQDKEGMWLKDQPNYTVFDQTAEIAIWLREISTELSLY